MLILTDDQWISSLPAMPNVRRLLGSHGITFSNAFATTPLCCPSRASILTGQYSRHTGVFNNAPPEGGVQAFRDRETIATWLKRGGYATSYIGKYLNDYEKVPGVRIPPGWDDWHVYAGVRDSTYPRIPVFFGLKGKNAFYYDYQLNENGRRVWYGAAPSDYFTTVTSNRALEFIDRSKRPFLLVLAPFAPHFPAIPAREDEDRFANEPNLRSPSFNEAVVRDKPWGDTRPPLTPVQIQTIDELHRNGLGSLQSVDRSIAAVVDRLKQAGELDRTVIVFTSDNGLLLGEHRILHKVWAYEQSIRVPMVARVPWIDEAIVDDRLVLNVDLASTFAELAGVTPRLPQDGRSLVPLMRRAAVTWRDEVLIEHLGTDGGGLFQPRRFFAIRTERWKLIEYQNGWRELYDLKRDPDELQNLAGQPEHRRVQQELSGRLARLRAD